MSTTGSFMQVQTIRWQSPFYLTDLLNELQLFAPAGLYKGDMRKSVGFVWLCRISRRLTGLITVRSFQLFVFFKEEEEEEVRLIPFISFFSATLSSSRKCSLSIAELLLLLLRLGSPSSGGCHQSYLQRSKWSWGERPSLLTGPSRCSSGQKQWGRFDYREPAASCSWRKTSEDGRRLNLLSLLSCREEDLEHAVPLMRHHGLQV